MTDWISVNDNTPNFNEAILIAFISKTGSTYCCVGLYDSGGFDGDSHSKNPHFDYEPTYWMYVPSYPSEPIKNEKLFEEKQIFTFKKRV